MKKKKLLLLGGSRYLIPVIKAAHNLGCYVITCDYLPDNYAHRFSDEYCNISIIDKDAVLLKAQELKINGIMSFACDPGVVTAAYVAEKMRLPSVGSYESVCILQNKGRFRQFLAQNMFNVPTAKSYTSIDCALSEIDLFHWPVIVKPTDSAGSKGVSRVDAPDFLRRSIENALLFSRGKEFIIEDFLQQKGFSSDSDSFSVDGEVKFVSFNSQRFDLKADNPYTPAAYSWPSSISIKHQKELSSEIQRLIHLLDLKTSIYNIETRECIDGKAYIMECSPRGGGNRLAECLKFATGIDLIANAVLAAIGEDVTEVEQKAYKGYWAEVVLHSSNPGVFRDISLSDSIKKSLVERDLWVLPGDRVEGFTAANEAIGTLVLCFETQEEAEYALENTNDWLKVIVEKK